MPEGTINYSFDPATGLLTKTWTGTNSSSPTTETLYDYDTQGRLTEVTETSSAGTTTAVYTYDAENNRVGEVDSTTIGMTTTSDTYQYVYDGSELVLTLNVTGGASSATGTQYLPDPNGGQAPLAQENSSGAVSWFLADQNDSVQDVINDSGTVVDHVVFDPYGNKIVADTGTAPQFGFQGMIQNNTFTVGGSAFLYYDNARYYSTIIGNFISQDPAQQGTNYYEFDGNNPITNTDPTGLMFSTSSLGSVLGSYGPSLYGGSSTGYDSPDQTTDTPNNSFGAGLSDIYQQSFSDLSNADDIAQQDINSASATGANVAAAFLPASPTGVSGIGPYKVGTVYRATPDGETNVQNILYYDNGAYLTRLADSTVTANAVSPESIRSAAINVADGFSQVGSAEDVVSAWQQATFVAATAPVALAGGVAFDALGEVAQGADLVAARQAAITLKVANYGLATLGTGSGAYALGQAANYYELGDTQNVLASTTQAGVSFGFAGLSLYNAATINIPELPSNSFTYSSYQYQLLKAQLFAQQAYAGRTLADPLPADSSGQAIALADPEAEGTLHTVLGWRANPTESPAPYAQAITYDEDGTPLYRIDFSNHGTPGFHTNPHVHLWDPTLEDFGLQLNALPVHH
jgi:RHS repeat-associated protein